MKKVLFLFLFFLSIVSFSQTLNLEEIKKNVTDTNSPYSYAKLVEEFQNQPSALKSDTLKSKYLYYGKLYSGNYKRASDLKSKNLKFIKLTGEGKYSEAVELGEELLKNDPVNLVTLVNMMACYENTQKNNEEKYQKVKTQMEILLSTIAHYGDGKTRETPFQVISMGDEYALLNYFGINLRMYIRVSEDKDKTSILDIWVKDHKYEADRRNKIYVVVYSAK